MTPTTDAVGYAAPVTSMRETMSVVPFGRTLPVVAAGNGPGG